MSKFEIVAGLVLIAMFLAFGAYAVKMDSQNKQVCFEQTKNELCFK